MDGLSQMGIHILNGQETKATIIAVIMRHEEAGLEGIEMLVQQNSSLLQSQNVVDGTMGEEE